MCKVKKKANISSIFKKFMQENSSARQKVKWAKRKAWNKKLGDK